MLPLFSALWKAYRTYLGDAWGSAGEILERSVAATGARLLQTAFEYGGMDSELHPSVLRLIRLAGNILARPQAAAEDLMGLTP
jgi:hypothetical protein